MPTFPMDSKRDGAPQPGGGSSGNAGGVDQLRRDLNDHINSVNPHPIFNTKSLSKVLTQDIPSSSWSFTNPFGRLCDVSVWIGTELVEADVNVSSLNINVAFATPQTGSIVVY